MATFRRYVCLAVHDSCSRAYPLHRIDASSLFYPSNQVKVVTTMPPDERPLPRPSITFSSPRSRSGGGYLYFFGLFGLGQKKSLLAAVAYDDGVSHTYDIDNLTINDIPAPQEKLSVEPISVALGDALFVMDSMLVPGRHSSCFEALTFGPPKGPLLRGIPHWHWHSLQPPPFMLEPGYKTTRVCAYTVVGGSSILVSTTDIGTYSFDTASSSWDKAGDWELPFCGRADFFPEYNAWLGFSAEDNRLCYSSDLATSMQHQPVLDRVWEDPNSQLFLDDSDPQRYTIVLKSHLVHLGSGKCCVAIYFHKVENVLTEHGNMSEIDKFIVFTGLVLEPSEFGRGIEMKPHKSVLYRLEGISNCWVF